MVLADCRVALLDQRAAAALARYPEIYASSSSASIVAPAVSPGRRRSPSSRASIAECWPCSVSSPSAGGA